VDHTVVATIRRRAIAYLFVDLRMSRERPYNNSFFHQTTAQAGVRQGRISLAALTKFRAANGARLIYNSGPVQIYDVRALRYG